MVREVVLVAIPAGSSLCLSVAVLLEELRATLSLGCSAQCGGGYGGAVMLNTHQEVAARISTIA